MTNKKLRFAVCGTGDFGPQFARYLNEVAEVVAICDPSPQSREYFNNDLTDYPQTNLHGIYQRYNAAISMLVSNLLQEKLFTVENEEILSLNLFGKSI